MTCIQHGTSYKNPGDWPRLFHPLLPYYLTNFTTLTMSDLGRQSLGDKAGAAMKPNSEKSYLEQASDSVKGALDSVASAVQPQQEKSTTQKVGDAITGDNTNRKLA